MAESKREIPEWCEIVTDIGGNQVIAIAPPEKLREQDKNANIMTPEMFRQLTENIKKKGQVESLPFCALTEKGVEIVSGHHRKRAAAAAQIKKIPFILDLSGLTKSQIAAKQIAHNAINGNDDKRILKDIVKLINDVDDMIESYIGNDILNLPDEELEKLLAPKLVFDWKQIQFMFLPYQLEDLEKLVASTEKADYIGAAERKQFDELIKKLAKFQKISNIKNIGAAIHKLIEVANSEIESVSEKGEWVSLASILGNITVPRETAIKLDDLIKEEIKNENLNPKRKWEILDILLTKNKK